MKIFRVVTRREIVRDGGRMNIPWWMGVAWFDYLRGEAHYCLIGLNVLVGKARDLWLWMKYVKPGRVAGILEENNALRGECDQLREAVTVISEESQRVQESKDLWWTALTTICDAQVTKDLAMQEKQENAIS